MKTDLVDVATDTFWGLLVLTLISVVAALAISVVVPLAQAAFDFFAAYAWTLAMVPAILYISYRIGHRWLGVSRRAE